MPSFLAISSLTLVMAVPVLGQANATVQGHTLESVTGLTDPNAMNEEWQTPLMAAASDADEQAVKTLIEHKANVNIGDRFGRTALNYARGVAVVRLLLAAGASANDKDVTGSTPLHLAAQRTDPEVVAELIKAGANVNAKDDAGMSPLKIAELNLCCTRFSDSSVGDAYRVQVQRVINLLLKAGALPEPLDNKREQPLGPQPETARLSHDVALIEDLPPDESIVTDSCDAHAGTTVPKFRVAQKDVIHDAKFVGLAISIAPRDADENNIVALACKLGEDYAREQSLVVWILDDYHAARQFRVSDTSEARRRAVRASYTFDRERNSQELTWTPDPRKPSHSVKIVLGALPDRR